LTHSNDQLATGSFRRLIRDLHRDERGGVSIETILIIAAIALPILIFIIKFGWPRIRSWFNTNMDALESGGADAATTE
jgi:Flp pilus assembly pilin Flp